MCGEYQGQLCRCEEASGTFVTVTMSREDWEEVTEALSSKELAIRRGELGPETRAGEDELWIEDLGRIADTIYEALQ
jgi:hypothetical protein